MTDSSEGAPTNGGKCIAALGNRSNSAVVDTPLPRLKENWDGSFTVEYVPARQPPAHADPRHPWHHVWVSDIERRIEALDEQKRDGQVAHERSLRHMQALGRLALQT